ncbi:MAG: hypothetical protein LBT09_10825 [Planctomycetaceae bacterium]|jgi:hypothetical protein|nr:hypothetical protein [Planctomycetaceae bacterium]
MKKIIVLVLAFLILDLSPELLNAAQYNRPNSNQTPFVRNFDNYNLETNNPDTNNKIKYSQNSINKQPAQLANNKQHKTQKNNSSTVIRQLPQPVQQQQKSKPAKPQTTKNNNLREVQFTGELFDMRILDADDDVVIVPKRAAEVGAARGNIGNETDADGIKPPIKLNTPKLNNPKFITPIEPNHVPSAGFLKYSEEYPDPRSIGTLPYARGGISPAPYNFDRSAAVPEHEAHQRYHIDEARKQAGQPPLNAADCPLCKDDPKTPCGNCPKCQKGYPCERTVCRHCVQPVSRNLNNFCDLTAGGEPCGTCDSCREHRSDPCGHADDGRGPHGEWNPYKQSRIFSVIPRPILDEWNNGARKFPVYYNPAPYYRPYWNPSLYTGYARPYTFRYTCPVCSDGVCKCNKPPFAGQVPFAYACKFCNRNPCACAEDICDANEEMQPSGRSIALDAARAKSTRIQDADIRSQNEANNPNTNTDKNNNQPTPDDKNEIDDEKSLLELFNEQPAPKPTQDTTTPTNPQNTGKRQSLDAPKTKSPNVIPRTGVIN